MISCLSDFKSSSTIPTATERFDDFLSFTKKWPEAIEIRDFSTFIQAVGKVHYLASNPDHRSDTFNCGDKKYRVFYRGQTKLYGKDHNSIVPSAFRCKDLASEIDSSIARLKHLKPLEGTGISDEAVEGLMQQYGAPSRWIDVVDNIWVALWFACHRVWISRDESQTKISKGYQKRSPIAYVHYERRVPELEHCSKSFAYVVLLGLEEELKLKSPGLYVSNRDELLNLRQAIPSQFIRPHVQHGWLIRRKKHEKNYVRDLRDMVLGVIKIPLITALSWLGESKAFEVSSIFPPPCFDTGWRDLAFRDECSKNRVFKQVICS